MAQVHVWRHDPVASDNESIGLNAGDVVINLLTGAMWYMGTVGGGWTAVASGNVTAAQILALDFSGAPTSDPGGGKLWLNGGVPQVGP